MKKIIILIFLSEQPYDLPKTHVQAIYKPEIILILNKLLAGTLH
jgi:hypothetical protein